MRSLPRLRQCLKTVNVSFSADSELYSEDYVNFSGTSEVARTDAGTTKMELAANQFENISENFDVVFEVAEDGSTVCD